jgi:hypothetical protein
MNQLRLKNRSAGIAGGNGTTRALQPAVWRRVIEVDLIAPYRRSHLDHHRRHVVPLV